MRTFALTYNEKDKDYQDGFRLGMSIGIAMASVLLLITYLISLTGVAHGQQYDVSDTQAAELVLVTTCTLPEHDKKELAARQAHIDKLKFVDRQGLGVILTQHCKDYNEMIKANDAAIDAAFDDAIKHHRSWTPGLDQEFQLRKNALVQATLDKIQAAYPDEYDGFAQHIQGQKKYMSHLQESPMMPGMTSEHHHAHTAGINAYQWENGSAGNYTDYGYTTYLNLSGNGYDMYITGAIVGTSSLSYWCTWNPVAGRWEPQGCNSSPYHQASIQSFSIAGGAPTYDNENYNPYGPQVNPSAYYSWSYSNNPSGWNFYGPSMTSPPTPNRPKLGVGGWIRVFCSIAQSFIIKWPIDFTVMEARTKGNLPTNTNQSNICAMQNWCSSVTTPPFYNFKKIILVPSTNQCYKNGGTYWVGYEAYTSVAGTGNKATWNDTGLGWAIQSGDAYPGNCDTWSSIPTP